MQAAVVLLITFDGNNQVLVRNCCYGNSHWTISAPSVTCQKMLIKNGANFFPLYRPCIYNVRKGNVGKTNEKKKMNEVSKKNPGFS